MGIWGGATVKNVLVGQDCVTKVGRAYGDKFSNVGDLVFRSSPLAVIYRRTSLR